MFIILSNDYSADKILTMGLQILRDLDKKNIKYHESNRFCLYLKTFQELLKTSGKLLENHIKKEYLIEGFRDLVEMEYICKNQILEMASTNENNILFGGSRTPNEDKQNKSRDIQYQMFIASRLKNSGFSILWEEPDIRMKFDDEYILLAVKRISSSNQIFKRIKEAEKQILNHDGNGIIVLSLDKVYNNDRLAINNPDQLYDMSHSILLDVMKKNFKSEYFLRNEKIKAMFVTLGLTAYLPEQESFAYGLALKVLPLATPDSFEYKKYSILGTNILN